MEPDVRVLGSRLLKLQEKSLRDFLSAASAEVGRPSAGTPAEADLELIEESGKESGLAGLRAWTHRACAFNILAAREHAEALRLVIAGSELLPLPAMSLARSVFEAVMNTCWLLDAEATSAERLARWAGRLLHDSQESPPVLSMIGSGIVPDKQQEEAEKGRELGQQLMARAGFVLKAKGGDRNAETANVTFRGVTSNLTPKVDDLFARFAPGEEFSWPILSGATHSRGWLVSGIEGDAETLVTSFIGPVLSASDALVVEVGRYVGVPVRDVLERTHFRRVAILNRVRPHATLRAGLDAYRASVGTWAVPPG